MECTSRWIEQNETYVFEVGAFLGFLGCASMCVHRKNFFRQSCMIVSCYDVGSILVMQYFSMEIPKGRL